MSRRTVQADLAVIGAGSGGLSVAAGAAQLGLNVVLFEKGEMGGDCLNFGCVPSKALIAAAEAAYLAGRRGDLGVTAEAVRVSFPAVMAHVRRAIAAVAPNDSQERFEGLGVRVVRERAAFTGPRSVASESVEVLARKIVIATGSRALAPPIAGLSDVPYLTNETVFGLDILPSTLIVLGGGPIGVELGQAFRRLGSKVVIIDRGAILAREGRDAADVVLAQLTAEGVDVLAAHDIVRVEAGPAVVVRGQAGERRILGSHLLVALGRRPDLSDLDLERANVAHSDAGVTTDASLRSTTNHRVFALGDVAGRGQFTHLAGAQAGLVIRRAVFGLPVRADRLIVPRVTYSDPEIAAIGLDAEQALRIHGPSVRVERSDFRHNDRAQAEDDTRGFAQLVTTRRGRILGATIVGRHAGDHIHIWALAMAAGLKVGRIAGMVAPYPTRGEINKRLAGQWFAAALFSKRARRLVSVLKHFV